MPSHGEDTGHSEIEQPPSPLAAAGHSTTLQEAQLDVDDSDVYGRSAEEDQLLGGGIKRTRDDSKGAWIEILGFKLPRSLAILLAIPLAILLLSLLFRLFPTGRQLAPLPEISNGTHLFHPTTIVVSLDGFRPSYFKTHAELVPDLIALGKSSIGLSAESMQPVFPTLTFPNHWALLTGLYPESHGIVANDFYAPDVGKEFSYSSPDTSWGPDWWWGEPMWAVAERGGRKSANIMWPGPPTTKSGISPSYFVPFKTLEPSEKLTQTLHYLDLPLNSRPSLILTYLPDVDQAGHAGGPESLEVEDALKRVDKFIGDLRYSLEARNLTQIVDLIVVSDHGMAATSTDRLVFLDDILGDEGFAALEHKDGWPSLGLRFKAGSDNDGYYDRLVAAANNSNGSFAVYTHETMPERWHFNRGSRIAPIYLVPDLGWVVTDHHTFDTLNKGELNPKGCHGFDNVYAEMQAIFFAHGPFASRLKDKATRRSTQSLRTRGWVSMNPHILEGFRNLELFDLVMRLQGLDSIAPSHNGSLSFWDTYL